MPALDDLKEFNVDAATVSLWVFKGPRGPIDAPPTYSGHWVETTDGVNAALKEAVNEQRIRIEETAGFGLLTQNNEGSALLIAKDETNADLLIEVVGAETENRRAHNAERMQNATFYLIKMIQNETALFAVRRTDNGWRTKRRISARSIVYDDNRLDLDNRPHFNLEKTIDYFILANDILILNKAHFESTLRYREAHQIDFAALQAETEFSGLFTSLAPLIQHVGVNKIQLRRMSAIHQKGYYRNTEFMARIRERHAEYGFLFEFDGDGKIVATPETCSQIITALLDHRLVSGFSGRVYDVQDAKPVTI